MAVAEAYLATQNCYFNYEFDELNLGDFPEELFISLRGMMYLHEIQYPNITYYIYFSDILTGAELEKMQTDFARYCPEE
ncbi:MULTISPECIES: hypothetical protein [Acinetobacter]|uniref:hypothetical protein n=1 Tax=Acinetobacter TaxID=469 RepID=UPI001444A258|nr:MULTISPECIES: hypothetical protein [Acinetobacter]MEB6564794.1 hypothetical protein [Acinetobacter towneri]UIP24342.1 hypothetical protein LZG54_09265 [Acinetobacter towneri]